MCSRISWATTGQPINSPVQKAIARFEKGQPHATLLRDLHEHMDSVIRGKGKAHSQLPDPDMESVVVVDDDDVVYAIGGQTFRIKPLAERAVELADELRSAFP